MSIERHWNSMHLWYVCAMLLFGTGNALASTAKQAEFENATPIPDSIVAKHAGQGIVAAMLSCATDRYAHAVLGDDIEAGCLIVLDNSGRSYTMELPDTQVFEDLEPRIADMDGNGSNDVIVIRSEDSAGAALAIYTIENEKLVELAATPPIGRSFRWLAPVGIADFNDDDQLDIAYVQTPHIGGILKVWSIIDTEFKQITELRGFSNHSIGSKRVSTARIVDYNNDGVLDIALPDQSRQNTVWITLNPELRVLDSKPYSLTYFD